MYHNNFYPRSPCGERHPGLRAAHSATRISIHALLAESDVWAWDWYAGPKLFLSTLSLRRATCYAVFGGMQTYISIHALLAESDVVHIAEHASPGGISIHALLAESDTIVNNIVFMPGKFLSTLSLRRATTRSQPSKPKDLFLSTLSLRRATIAGRITSKGTKISIHALLAESDVPSVPHCSAPLQFLSTLSLRRATATVHTWKKVNLFLSTLSLRRATQTKTLKVSALCNFYPRSPCGERRGRQPALSQSSEFLSTLSLRRATAIGKWDRNGYDNFYPRSPCGERQHLLII